MLKLVQSGTKSSSKNTTRCKTTTVMPLNRKRCTPNGIECQRVNRIVDRLDEYQRRQKVTSIPAPPIPRKAKKQLNIMERRPQAPPPSPKDLRKHPSLVSLEHSRVSPELYKILREHPIPRLDESLTTPVKVPAQKSKQKFIDPTAMDDINPMLAAYMKTVMEQNSDLNHIYGVDFYNNIDYLEIAAKMTMDLLNFNQIAELLQRLARGEHLSDEDMVLVELFLQLLANMGAGDIAHYLQLLKNQGALTLDVMDLLKRLLESGSIVLSADQKHVLFEELNYLNELEKRHVHFMDMLKMLNLQLTPSQLDMLEWAFELAGGMPAFEASGKRLVNFLLSNVAALNPELAQIVKDALLGTKPVDTFVPKLATAEGVFPTIPAPPPTLPRTPSKRKILSDKRHFPFEPNGYYEPWEANLHWEQDMQSALKIPRKSQIDLNSVHYRKDTLEYYQAENLRQQLLEQDKEMNSLERNLKRRRTTIHLIRLPSFMRKINSRHTKF